jgi:hypothetical protein
MLKKKQKEVERHWTLKDLQEVTGEAKTQRALEMIQQRRRRNMIIESGDGAYD